MNKKAGMPSLPTAKTEYTAQPATEGDIKNDKGLADLKRRQKAFIAQGSGKPGESLDNDSVRFGFTISGEQKIAFKLLQAVLPKKTGRKLSISYQDYLSEAFDQKLRQDAKAYGITINLPEEEK